MIAAGKARLYCFFTGVEILDRCVNDTSVGEPAEGALTHRSKISTPVKKQ